MTSNIQGALALVGELSPKAEVETAPLTRREGRLVEAMARIEACPPTLEQGLIIFGYRTLAVATLPYNEPKASVLVNGAWIRRSGQWSVYVQGGPKGIPYGTSPRLFLYFAVSEVIRTGSQKINIGSFRSFCKRLDIDPSMGKRGQGKYMLEQLDRVLATRWCIARDSQVSGGRMRSENQYIQFVDKTDLYWHRKQTDDQFELFESSITLSAQMYEELQRNPVPLDLRAVRELKSKPMALDIYSWLAVRMFSLRESTKVPWAALQLQFGTDYARLRDFRRAFCESLHRAMLVYPKLRITEADDGLILYPSPPPVSGRVLVAVK